MILARALAAVVVLSPFAPAQDAPTPPAPAPPDPFVVYRGTDGVGAGRHVVFVTGDEEYRSEEGMPQLARILAFRHGFTCTVLFAVDPATGMIDPVVRDHIPGLEALDRADLMVVFTRFRDLPDEEMAHFVRYVESGKPIVGLRTATHAFDFKEHATYRRYGWRNDAWDGGFGRQVLGETWIAHHGDHGAQSTRGVPAPGAAAHPILRGIEAGDVWDPSDVYAVRLPLPDGCAPVLLGAVLDGMTPDAAPAAEKNDPMMPVAWTRTRTNPEGARVFTTTLGAAQAFARAGTRRLLVNACLWALGMEDAITPDLDVTLVGPFDPSPFGFGAHRKGVRPVDLAWPVESAPRTSGR